MLHAAFLLTEVKQIAHFKLVYNRFTGFNIEYDGAGFVTIFIAEYGSIIFISFLTRILLLGGRNLIRLKTLFIRTIFLII